MIVYRIASNAYAGKLQASGMAARWNSRNQKVIYTSESRSLACLENLAHRSLNGLSGLFKTQIIEIPDHLVIKIMDKKNLPAGWSKSEHSGQCRKIGATWFISGESPILKVPSALIPQEYNYVIHEMHAGFEHIRILDIEEFTFDLRLKL